MIKRGTKQFDKWYNSMDKKQKRFSGFLRRVLTRRGYNVRRTIFIGHETGWGGFRLRLEPRHLEAWAFEYGKILCKCCGKFIITMEEVSFDIMDLGIPSLRHWGRDSLLIVANPNLKYGQIDVVKTMMNVEKLKKFLKVKKKRKKKETKKTSVGVKTPYAEWRDGQVSRRSAPPYRFPTIPMSPESPDTPVAENSEGVVYSDVGFRELERIHQAEENEEARQHVRQSIGAYPDDAPGPTREINPDRIHVHVNMAGDVSYTYGASDRVISAEEVERATGRLATAAIERNVRGSNGETVPRETIPRCIDRILENDS